MPEQPLVLTPRLREMFFSSDVSGAAPPPPPETSDHSPPGSRAFLEPVLQGLKLFFAVRAHRWRVRIYDVAVGCYASAVATAQLGQQPRLSSRQRLVAPGVGIDGLCSAMRDLYIHHLSFHNSLGSLEGNPSCQRCRYSGRTRPRTIRSVIRPFVGNQSAVTGNPLKQDLPV